MSHFVGLVFGNNIDEALKPYDENLEVEPYIEYTKEEAIDKVKRENVEIYERALEILREDPKSEWANKIIEKGIGISYDEAWEEAKDWGYDIDDNENLLSTYNPNSKWDWFTEGGRWGNWLLLKEKDSDGEPYAVTCASKSEIDWDLMLSDRIPFCFVTEDGKWHEKASMGWFAVTSNNKEEDDWDREFKEYLDSVEDDVEITVIDFHI